MNKVLFDNSIDICRYSITYVDEGCDRCFWVGALRRCRTWLQFFVWIFSKFVQSAEGSGDIAVRLAFLITDWSRFLPSAFRYPHQAGLAYGSCETRVAGVTSHSAFPLDWDHERGWSLGHRRNDTFCNKDGNVMLKCQSVTNSYPKYVHFAQPLDYRDSSRAGKMLSPLQGVSMWIIVLWNDVHCRLQ